MMNSPTLEKTAKCRAIRLRGVVKRVYGVKTPNGLKGLNKKKLNNCY